VLKLLANEKVATDVVLALRADGHDVAWIEEVDPGSDDEAVLPRALSEQRVLLTFDKDFGELAFHRGLLATPGVILLRPRLRSPGFLVRFARAVLALGQTWEGHFAVAEEGRLRIVPLPSP
jgi:predicted nuclease of predicted toxin-antitoxin system